MKCPCRGQIVCLECRAEIARRVAGEGSHVWTWSVAGNRMLWSEIRKARDGEESFGWSPP